MKSYTPQRCNGKGEKNKKEFSVKINSKNIALELLQSSLTYNVLNVIDR